MIRSFATSALVVIAPFDVLRDVHGRLLFEFIHPIVQLCKYRHQYRGVTVGAQPNLILGGQINN